MPALVPIRCIPARRPARSHGLRLVQPPDWDIVIGRVTAPDGAPLYVRQLDMGGFAVADANQAEHDHGLLEAAIGKGEAVQDT